MAVPSIVGLSALCGTKCRKVPKSADECRDNATRPNNEYDSYTSRETIQTNKTNGTARHETQEWSKSRALAHIPHMEHAGGCPDTNPAGSDVEEQKTGHVTTAKLCSWRLHLRHYSALKCRYEIR